MMERRNNEVVLRGEHVAQQIESLGQMYQEYSQLKSQYEDQESKFEGQLKMFTDALLMQLIARIIEISGNKIADHMMNQMRKMVHHQLRRILQNKPVEPFTLWIPVSDILNQFEDGSSDFVGFVNFGWWDLSKKSGIQAKLEGPTHTDVVSMKNANFRFTLSKVKIDPR